MPVRYFPPEYCIRPRLSAEKPSGAQASIGKPFERTAALAAIIPYSLETVEDV